VSFSILEEKKMEKIAKLVFWFFLVGGLFCCASNQARSERQRSTKPVWVDNPSSVYDPALNISAVGYGNNREVAEKNALSNLLAIFGQSIQVDRTVANTYLEVLQNGAGNKWLDEFAIHNTVSTQASLDNLVGAEIKELWYDLHSETYYAVAVMGKMRTSQIYDDMIKDNQRMIVDLTTMNTTEKNSLTGIFRYQFAAIVADINFSYANILKVIGVGYHGTMEQGDTYRLEAQKIASTVPIGIKVFNDKNGRIHNAFAKAFLEHGFKTGGDRSRYLFDVEIAFSPVEITNNSNRFTRITLNSNLVDTSNNTVLLPWSYTDRHGHLTLVEAENRAYIAAENRIKTEFNDVLTAFLSQMIGK